MKMKIKNSDAIASISFAMGMLSALKTVNLAIDKARLLNVDLDGFQGVVTNMINDLSSDIPEDFQDFESSETQTISSLFGEQEGTLQ